MTTRHDGRLPQGFAICFLFFVEACALVPLAIHLLTRAFS